MSRSPLPFALLVLALLLSAGCRKETTAAAPPPPQEITTGATGRYCGMALSEHNGPKAQILLKSQHEPVWFSSVRDVFAFTLIPEEPKDIAAIYVHDLARAKNWDQPEPGMWVEARHAFFVLGSRKDSAMGAPEAFPFSDEAAAHAFTAAHGGRVVRFAAIREDFVFGDPSSEPISVTPIAPGPSR